MEAQTAENVPSISVINYLLRHFPGWPPIVEPVRLRAFGTSQICQQNSMF